MLETSDNSNEFSDDDLLGVESLGDLFADEEADSSSSSNGEASELLEQRDRLLSVLGDKLSSLQSGIAKLEDDGYKYRRELIDNESSIKSVKLSIAEHSFIYLRTNFDKDYFYKSYQNSLSCYNELEEIIYGTLDLLDKTRKGVSSYWKGRQKKDKLQLIDQNVIDFRDELNSCAVRKSEVQSRYDNGKVEYDNILRTEDNELRELNRREKNISSSFTENWSVLKEIERDLNTNYSNLKETNNQINDVEAQLERLGTKLSYDDSVTLERAKLSLLAEDWKSAHRLAQVVADADPRNYRALLYLHMSDNSIARFEDFNRADSSSFKKDSYSQALLYTPDDIKKRLDVFTKFSGNTELLSPSLKAFSDATGFMSRAEDEQGFKNSSGAFASFTDMDNAKELSDKCAKEAIRRRCMVLMNMHTERIEELKNQLFNTDVNKTGSEIQDGLEKLTQQLENYAPEFKSVADVLKERCENLTFYIQKYTDYLYDDKTTSKNKRKRTSLIMAVTIIILAIISGSAFYYVTEFRPGQAYKAAMKLYNSGEYAEAENEFRELGAYRDSSKYVTDSKYQRAVVLFEAANYKEARKIWEELGSYLDSPASVIKSWYYEAKEAKSKKDYLKAVELFMNCQNYSDSISLIADCYYSYGQELYNSGNYVDASDYYDLADEEYKLANISRDFTEERNGCTLAAVYDLMETNKDKETDKTYSSIVDKLISLGDYENASDLLISQGKAYVDFLMKNEEYSAALNNIDKIPNGYETLAIQRLDCHFNIANNYFNNNQYDLCIDYISENLPNHKASVELLYKLFDIKLQKNETGRAEDIISIFTDDDVKAEYTFKLAEYYETNSNPEKAKEKCNYIEQNYRVSNELKKNISNLYNLISYKEAANALANSQYEKAISIFESLGDYNDSRTKRFEAMYSYVSENKKSDNTTTYEYLKVLKESKYLDSNDIYNKLYSWSVNVVINNSENDTKTDIKTLSNNKDFFIHATVQGGTPGSTIGLDYKVQVPNDSEKHRGSDDRFRNKMSDSQSAVAIVRVRSKDEPLERGEYIIYVYDSATNKELVRKSVTVK